MRLIPLTCDNGDRVRERLVAVDVIESAGDTLPLRAGAAVFDLATGGRIAGGRIRPAITLSIGIEGYSVLEIFFW